MPPRKKPKQASLLDLADGGGDDERPFENSTLSIVECATLADRVLSSLKQATRNAYTGQLKRHYLVGAAA